MKKAVSVILPVYNGEKYIFNTLESLFHQTYSNYELIIIDDGSTDASRKLILKYMHDHPIDFHLIMKENQGVSKARNDGIRAAEGKYLVFIDVDDTFEKNYLEKLVHSMDENDSDLIMCSYIRKDENNTTVEQFQFPNRSMNQNEFFNTILPRHTALWNKIFKNSIIQQNHLYFDSTLAIGEDFNFLTDYILKCRKMNTIQDSLYTYHISSSGAMSQGMNSKKLTEWKAINQVEKKLTNHTSVSNKMQYKKVICAHKLILLSKGKEEYRNERKEMLEYLKKNRWSIIHNKEIPFKFRYRLIELSFKK